MPSALAAPATSCLGAGALRPALRALAAVGTHAGDAAGLINPDKLEARLRARVRMPVIGARTPQEPAQQPGQAPPAPRQGRPPR